MDSVWKLSGSSVMKFLRRAGEILRHAEIAALRREDHRRRIIGYLRLGRHGHGLRRPWLRVALRGPGAPGGGRRCGVATAVAPHPGCGWIAIAHVGGGSQ